MKLEIKKVATKDLVGELRRRRATLIDALCEELDITEHEVEHVVSVKQRARRDPADELVERLTVDGVGIELAVKAFSDAGCIANCLELRYGFVDPENDKVARPRRAVEPATGFDIIRLAKRIADVVNEGIQIHTRRAIFDHAQECADSITNEFGTSETRFRVRPTDHFDKDDFGPLEITLSGLCSHLAVKLIRIIDKHHAEGDCGIPEPVRAALEQRATATPDKELN